MTAVGTSTLSISPASYLLIQLYFRSSKAKLNTHIPAKLNWVLVAYCVQNLHLKFWQIYQT